MPNFFAKDSVWYDQDYPAVRQSLGAMITLIEAAIAPRA
jgi:hypothetical protein